MAKPRTGENRFCKACGKEYYAALWRLKRGDSKFCSQQCQNHKQYERFIFNCQQCGKKCEASPSRRKSKKRFCSIKCSETAQINLKLCAKEKRRSAIAKLRAEGKSSNRGASVRKFALKNKPAICEICGFKEYECCLDIHHQDSNPNNNSLENLKILCVMCHRKIHRKLIKF